MKDEAYYLQAAIQQLCPIAEFSFKEADYSTIEWVTFDGDAPTQAQINKTIEDIKKAELKAENDAIAKKAAAEAKLALLGLTSDDLKALGLG